MKTLRIALHALRRNVMRSVLTCLGIIIGIAAVIAMMEIGQGSSHAIQQTIASMGANSIGIEPRASQSAGVSAGAATGLTLSPEDADALIQECSAVRWAAPSVDGRAQLVYGNKNWNPSSFKGTTSDYLLVKKWTDLIEGIPFSEDDVRRAAPVCLLGQTVVKELFGGSSPIGKEVRVKNV